MVAAVDNMAYVGEVPWHGLGVQVPAEISAKEMLKVSGLDWHVKKEQLSYVRNGQTMPTDQYALIRATDGKYLTAVGKGWEPVQNEDAFETFAEFVEKGDMRMNTAGSLNDGKDVFVLASLEVEREVVQDDAIQGYMLFHNPHRFGKSWQIMSTNVRVVCNNTLTYAMQQQRQGDFRYARSHASKIDIADAKRAVAEAVGLLDRYTKQAQHLASVAMPEEDFVEYVREIIPSKSTERLTKNQELITQALTHQPGVEFGEGTWWQGFNAVTFATDHLMLRDNESRMSSAWFGQNRTRKEKALELALRKTGYVEEAA